MWWQSWIIHTTLNSNYFNQSSFKSHFLVMVAMLNFRSVPKLYTCTCILMRSIKRTWLQENFEDTKVVTRSRKSIKDSHLTKQLDQTHWLVGCMVLITPLSTIFQLYRGGQFYWGPRENQRHVASHWQTLSHNVVHLVLIEIRTHNISGDRHWLHS